MNNVNGLSIQHARNQRGVNHWDSAGQHGFDNGRPLNYDGGGQSALSGIIATAGLSTMTFTLDNSGGGGVGFDLIFPLFNAYTPIYDMNNGQYVPNSGAQEIDVTIDSTTGNVVFKLHSDPTKYATLSCQELPYIGVVNSSLVRPFMVRTIQYEYDATDTQQSKNQILFTTGINMFGFSSQNPLSPSKFKPLMLQTPGLLGIDLSNVNNNQNFLVNAETLITHKVTSGKSVTMIFGVALINTGNVTA